MVHNIILDEPVKRKLERLEKIFGIGNIGSLFDNGSDDEVAVDPDSGLKDTCHVLKGTETSEIFTAVLGLVDITRGTNSYYKLQLLQSDNGRQWFFF
ncbi:unnamed protein product [Rotaria sordida]|uniref:WGR domain-containing protein n=1 Tax=Rotaria sordida TaxID=392033 RepID=A0A815JAN4_9BILA|nr:unnamed protein product [Rotaria sordida]CAF1614323.1 unnamed protein product [Rotaria sordida]